MGLLQTASKTVVGIDILFLLLLGFSLAFLERGSASYVTAVVTLVPVVLTFAAALLVLYTGWEPFD